MFVYGRPNPDGSDNTTPMSIIIFDDLLGRRFLQPLDENGERKRATFSEHFNVLREDQLYNQLMAFLGDQTDMGPLEDGFYRFKCITDHNLLIEWETVEQTWETLSNIITVYATKHDFLNTPGWKLSKR